MATAKVEARSTVERLYAAVRDMAIAYRFRPGERVNEVELASRLGGSRTPLREALNRLAAEGFLHFRAGQGFFCRDLRSRDVFELYQLRSVIETAGVRLACEHAADSELEELSAFLDRTAPGHVADLAEQLLAYDEHFHRTIISMSRNREMQRVFDNICARIKFVRWIDMEARRHTTQGEHREILSALRRRDPDLAGARIAAHISRRMDQITAAIKEGYSRIYMAGEEIGDPAAPLTGGGGGGGG